MARRGWLSLVWVGCGSALLLAALFGLMGDAAAAHLAAPQAELRVCASGCAYTNVQAAVDAAQAGDVIKIATGVYTGVTSRNALQQIAFITKSLTMRGGYSADFVSWDPMLYPTVLNAEGAGRVIYAEGAISLTLDGLRLLNGFHSSAGGGVYAHDVQLRVLSSVIQGSRINAGDGIGLYLSGGSLYIADSRVQESQPAWSDIWTTSGGGIYATGAAVEIRDSEIMSNTSAVSNWQTLGRGGGIFLDSCTAVLQGVTFSNNLATTGSTGRGGGLGTQGGTLRLIDCTFAGNTAAASDGGAGGGAYLRTNYALVSGNVFTANLASQAASPTGSGGGLDIGNSWESTTSIMGVTVTHNLLQNNTAADGGGMVAKTAVVLTVDNNQFVGNHNSGLSVVAKSDIGAPTQVVVRDNLFQGNSAGGNGGAVIIYGAVDVLFNRFISNSAGGGGGGVYQGEISRFDNASATYDGNLFRGNSAAEGGGLYTRPEYSENLNISYRNMAFLDNIATGTGGGIFIRRYASTPIAFKHVTLAGDHGGDGAMVYVVMGKVTFANTILYSGTVGIKVNSGPVVLDHVLRDDVVTPTLGLWYPLQDTNPITASPAFAADGYHLTSASAAVDAGIDAGVVDDIDGEPRPLGTAPDLGADESPFALSASGMQVTKLADVPAWKAYYTGINVPPSTILEQSYLIPYVYNVSATAPHVISYTIRDVFPQVLDLVSTATPQGLSYADDNGVLVWSSQAQLAPGDWGWVGLTGRSDGVIQGQSISNTGQMVYALSNGQTYTVPLAATTKVPPRPVFAPLLVTPLDGEMCLDAGNRLTAYGVAGVGMTVRVYEDGSLKADTLAGATGEFTLTWTSALTLTHSSVSLYTVACEPGGTCSTPSRTVHLTYPQADWCPQRSYWEGDVMGIHHVFHFVNDQGRYASNDFFLPGVYGFHNTEMHLFSCCPHNETNPFKVIADGTEYTMPSAHDGRWWTFTIGLAHDVTVESQCDGQGSTYEPKSTNGQVLIDPDGFVFDVTQGGGYSAVTGMYAPVDPLSGITVTAYVSMPEWGGWIPWPAHLYEDQINPQVTGANGYFAFFTPPGFYYLQVEGRDGYQSWRSPVIQVISEIVHVNVPLTPWSDAGVTPVVISTDGPHPSTVTLAAGEAVRWSPDTRTLTPQLMTQQLENPSLHPLGARDPLSDTTGFDGGMLAPGQAYQRQFVVPGTYTYTDGLGHTGTVLVTGHVFLPLVLRR